MLEESTCDGGFILVADAVVRGIVLASVPEVGICDAEDGNDVGNNVVASVAGVTNWIVVVEVVVLVVVVEVLVVGVVEVLLGAGVAEVLVDVAVVLLVVEVAGVVDLVAVPVVLVVCVVEETVYVVVASLQTQDFSIVTEMSIHSPLHFECHAAFAGGVPANDFTLAYRLHALSSSRSFNAVVLGFWPSSIQ